MELQSKRQQNAMRRHSKVEPLIEVHTSLRRDRSAVYTLADDRAHAAWRRSESVACWDVVHSQPEVVLHVIIALAINLPEQYAHKQAA
eukprot:12978-Chlamydomonas_euryale.AAC.3